MTTNRPSELDYSDRPFARLSFWLPADRSAELATRLRNCAAASAMSFRKDNLPVFGGYAGVSMFGESINVSGGFGGEEADRFYFELGFYAPRRAGSPERRDVVETFEACVRDLPGLTDLKRHDAGR